MYNPRAWAEIWGQKLQHTAARQDLRIAKCGPCQENFGHPWFKRLSCSSFQRKQLAVTCVWVFFFFTILPPTTGSRNSSSRLCSTPAVPVGNWTRYIRNTRRTWCRTSVDCIKCGKAHQTPATPFPNSVLVRIAWFENLMHFSTLSPPAMWKNTQSYHEFGKKRNRTAMNNWMLQNFVNKLVMS